MIESFTLPNTNMDPDHGTRKDGFLCKPVVFRVHLSFARGKQLIPYMHGLVLWIDPLRMRF